jgi:hypothetical protein
VRGANWTPLQIPLAAGVNQRMDDRALPAPQLAAAVDVQFDEVGGIQTRKPLSLLGSTTATGGTISTARRMYEYGRELILFDKDTVYSWNSDASRWVSRATHLAVSLEEKTVYATPGDQYDCDRAELSGIVFHAFTDTDKVYLAVSDKTSGAVLLSPTAVTGTTHTRPRLVACNNRVLLFCHEGTDSVVGNITVRAFDPTATNPATWSTTLGAAGVTVLAAASSGAYYDAVYDSANAYAVFAARRAVTTSYEVATVTDAATPVVTASTKARTCDGPIAVATDPAGDYVQVIRANGTNIQGDRLNSNLSDDATGQAVGTVSSGPVDHVTCAFRSTQDSGAYRCYAFWTHDQETGAGAWECKSNYVDTGGTIGTEGNFVLKLGIGSRAFSHDGRVYFWGVFAGESSFSGASPSAFRSALQNTYFLYRDDATFHAKCASTRGGGLSLSLGRLPGVALTSGTTVYSWCATEKRVIPIGTSGEQYGYGDRGPRDVTFTFDSNEARRCVKLGETLYVSGAEILQYDGVGLYEVGYHVFPWYFGIVEVAAGNLADGTYTYKVTTRWENAKGEQDRSTTATHGNVTIAAGPNGGSIASWPPLYTTHKTNKPVSFEVWRTAVNPTDGAPFYLVTSKDPASLTNPNRYIPNDTTASSLPTFNDEFADTTATTKETNDENGDVLENLAPPGASVIAATDTRIFLGNVAGDPDRIWYSKQRQAGKVASFHDALTFDVPKDGGEITGIAFQNGICVVFRETATYMFPGDGFDNTGRGQNYGPPQVVSYDVGCRDTDSIVVTPNGIAFQSSKGKYLLTRGWTMQPIGLNVVDYDSETVVAAHIVTAQHQVRFVTSSRILVWDYLVDAWAEWSVSSAVHAGIWQSTYHYLAAAGPYAEQTTYTGTSYGQDWTTAWIKPGDPQGKIAVKKLQMLGEHRSSSYHIRTRVSYDYDTTVVDDSAALIAATSGDPLQHNVRMSRRKCEAFKLRMSVHGTSTLATIATSSGSVSLSAGTWTATLRAVPLGEVGNGITVTLAVTAGSNAVTVRDHYRYSGGTWVDDEDNVGILVTGSPTISTVEAAIGTGSNLLSVSSAHASPSATITAGTFFYTFTAAAGGAFAGATGESLKVTGLAMEVGVEPQVFKRFARV